MIDLAVYVIAGCAIWCSVSAYAIISALDKGELQRRQIIAELETIKHRVSGIDARGFDREVGR